MYSFDIFDTLITRSTCEPKGIFMLMQKKLGEMEMFDPFFSANFYELRVGSEELARQVARVDGRQDVTIEEIYKALAMTACITKAQQKELEILEVETEYNNTLGITRNIHLLKDLKNRGEHVVLISDMYLGEKNIRYILSGIDSVFNEIPIYVSSDYGKTKGTGGLYHIVKNKEKVNFSEWVHYGDNEYADIKSAFDLGITAIHLAAENIAEYEQPQMDFYHQLSSGISKYIRGFGNESIASEVGGSLAGPILYPYISWLLKKSMEMDIIRLYFVARDGWILKQIADVIIQARNYPIKTHYIYGSRKAWRLPSYEGSKEDFDRIIKWSNMDEVLSLNDLAEVFQLKTEELRPFLQEEYRGIEGTQQLHEIQLLNLSEKLRENEIFRNYLVEKQTENQKYVIEYLRQEIDVSDERYAFVELSGTGLTQQCLARLIKKIYNGKIRNFFFKLDTIQKEEYCQFINFYPSYLKRSYMLELLCRAPHGQTKGYMDMGGRIEPVIETVEGESIKAYHIEPYRDAVLNYVNLMEQMYAKNGFEYNARIDIVKEYMNVITTNPPERIANYFCNMPFSSGGRKNTIVRFAPEVSDKQLREIYFWNNGKNARQVYQGNSLDYALVASYHGRMYKEKCQRYRESLIGKWLVGWNRYFRMHQKAETDFFCPWELLRGNIIIFGAGKVGQAYVKQAKQKYAKCDSLLWVDNNYSELQRMGMEVRAPQEIMGYAFDRIIIAIHNMNVRREIRNRLCEMGIEPEKIYYG